MNVTCLVGNLSKDMVLRYSGSGSAIASTSIAVSRKFKGQNGEQKEETLFIDLTFFGRSAEIANQYLKRGSKISVVGRLKLDQWKAQDGTNRQKIGVIVESMTMLDTKGSNTGSGMQYNNPSDMPDNDDYSKEAMHKRAELEQQRQYATPSPQEAPQAQNPSQDSYGYGGKSYSEPQAKSEKQIDNNEEIPF